jgi:hypothetical protein
MLAWSKAAADLYGFDATAAIGRPISSNAPAGRWGEIVSVIQTAQRGKFIQDHVNPSADVPHGNHQVGGGSLRTSQKSPNVLIASVNWPNSTGLRTYALAPFR